MDINQLMEEVKAADAADSSVHEEFWRGERPQIFSLANMFPFPERLESEFEQMSRAWDIESLFEIRSQRKIVGPVIVFVKKVILSLTRWYMNPVLFEVKRANMMAADSLRGLNESVDVVKKRIAELEEMEEELRRRLDGMEKDSH